MRQCDDNTLIVGRRNVVVPNAFVIELLPEIHRLISASPLPVAPVLAAEVRRHAAQQGYTFAGPVAVDLCPAPGDTAVRFRVHSRIAPARGRLVATGLTCPTGDQRQLQAHSLSGRHLGQGQWTDTRSEGPSPSCLCRTPARNNPAQPSSASR
ncbi:FhaA domain-containing protein [Streptomyces sp. NPDC058812]|uniref:FhaA domain-containing protein n=1 Tax=unclassified Streptomyces TaxID=2593676 RepID=UPI0036D07440